MNVSLGLPLAVREDELAKLEYVKPERTKDVRFQGKLMPFRVARVRIELPKYRLENGRTSAAQQDYIAKQRLESNFFDPSRSENDEVQLAQHKILKEMAENADPEKNLLKYFASHEQDDPLILDSKGFVVNGNRRLCSMRELFDKDPKKFGGFSHIDVVLLPNCSPKDVDELEVILQVEKDIKQDYSWINLFYSIRQKLNSGQYTEERLCSIYGKTSKELKSMLGRLGQAEDYLASRNKVGQYLDLDKAQLAFEQLQKSRPKLATTSQQDFFTEVSYQIIETASGDRAYSSIPEALDAIEDIHKDLVSDVLKEEYNAEKKVLANLKPDDLFGKSSQAETDYAAAFKALRKAEDKQVVRAAIQNAIDAKREREKLARRGNAALSRIRDANTALADAIAALQAQTTKTGIAEQLESIDQHIKTIREWLTK